MNQFTKTFGAKATAIGFIALILLGNYWLVHAVIGITLPAEFFNLILYAVVVVLAGGLLSLAELFFA